MNEIHLNLWVNEDESLGSDFVGTERNALQMIAFAVHLLADMKQLSHLEVLSHIRGLLDNGEFEPTTVIPENRTVN